MDNTIYNQATFLISAAELKQLPRDIGKEVAFIGRSNAGKSSAINTITGIKNLARASKTPGRTQLINLFALDDKNRLVDLPGYGYAKAPATVSERWIEKVNQYLKTRKCLRGLILVMDIRHPLKEQDQHLIKWCAKCKLPIHILLTKADKLKRGPALNTLQQVQKALKKYGKLVSIQLFSSLDKTGLDEAYQKLDEWLAIT
jgi:GTP-binding protein